MWVTSRHQTWLLEIQEKLLFPHDGWKEGCGMCYHHIGRSEDPSLGMSTGTSHLHGSRVWVLLGCGCGSAVDWAWYPWDTRTNKVICGSCSAVLSSPRPQPQPQPCCHVNDDNALCHHHHCATMSTTPRQQRQRQCCVTATTTTMRTPPQRHQQTTTTTTLPLRQHRQATTTTSGTMMLPLPPP